MGYCRGRSRNLRKGAGPSRSLPLPLFSPFPFPSSPLYCLEVWPLKLARGAGGALLAPSVGFGAVHAQAENNTITRNMLLLKVILLITCVAEHARRLHFGEFDILIFTSCYYELFMN